MRKKKSRRSTMKKTTARAIPEENPKNPLEEGNQDEQDKIRGFYACYLLTSLCPRFKGHTYIGFTVNPRRRIRQHNGEIRSGAFRTKKRRPWEMVFCIYGFPTNISALQFEWAWQHPTESLQVRQAAATFKSFSGVANKIKLAYTMLNLTAWKSLNITVNYFSTKYSKHSAGCPSLPDHMKVEVLPIDDLPCYIKTRASSFQCEDDELGFDDNDRNESFKSDSGAANESLAELQSHSIDEFRSSTSGEKSSPGACGGSESSKEDEAYNEDRHKRINLDNTDEMSREKFERFDEFRSSSVGEKSSPGAYGRSKSSKEDEAYNEDSHKRQKLDKSDEISCEKFGWFEEYNNEQQCLRSISADYSPISKVDYNSTVRTASSVFTTFYMDNGDRDALSNVENLSDKFDEGQSSYEIEVIDLLSPSPECRIVSGRKKRRVSSAFPVIIDLT